MLREGESWTELYDGALRVIQHDRGYRLSLEAMLLSHFCRDLEGRAVEIGTGSGVVALSMASFGAVERVDALEIQPAVADRARRAVRAAGLSERIEVHEADARAFDGRGYDAVVSNPPYFKLGSGAVNPDSERAIARHELCLDLDGLLACARKMLGPRGQLRLCYPTPRLAELLHGMRAVGVEPRRLRVVHPAPGEEARFALVSGQRGAGIALEVAPPLYVRDEAGQSGNRRDVFSAEVRDILAGAWQAVESFGGRERRKGFDNV